MGEALRTGHNTVGRYALVLARRRLLPEGLYRTHAAHPILALFSWLINTGTLAIVAAMTVTSFAIALYFSRRQDGNRMTTVVLPVIAGLVLAVIGGLAALRFDILVGMDGPLAIVSFPARATGSRDTGFRHCKGLSQRLSSERALFLNLPCFYPVSH